MEPKHPARRAGLPFLAAGIAFIAVSFTGQAAFLGVGLGLVGMGFAFALPARRGC